DDGSRNLHEPAEVRADVIPIRLDDRRPDRAVAGGQAEEGAQSAAGEAGDVLFAGSQRGQSGGEDLRQMAGERERPIVPGAVDAVEDRAAVADEVLDQDVIRIDEPAAAFEE